ncbi:MAG: ABC transporter substrate-binding protein [Proteobacteria bacterium]|nr:ABC transporter substrate-binding protein [Pseudomonadota bacterium]
MILRHLLLPALLLILGVSQAAAQNTGTPLKVALPEGPDTRYAGFLIAQQRGYFADAGLDVTFDRLGYGRSPIDPLSESKADLAVEIMPIALAKRERGADVVHVAQIFQRATLGLYCRATIDQPTKLAGHNVGVWLDGWESPFYAWLGRLGLSYFATGGGVTIVRQGTDAEIFEENEVDCLTSTTYRVPLVLGAGAVKAKNLILYRYQDQDLGVLEDGLYARGADLKNPARIDAFKRFLAAAARGWQSLHDDPSEAESLIEALPDSATLDEKAVAESLSAVSEAVGAGNIDLGALDDAAYDRTILLLLTGAPDPALAAAPSGAVSPVLRQVP